ncbi:MAG: hypothetical protein WBP10_16895 [Thermoanaerobaculia bacterium]
MGTFHQDKGELHGITVVVDTVGDEVYIGRCDEMTEERILLHDVDVHRDGEDGRSKDQYVERAARFGIWKKLEQLAIPTEAIASVRRLGDL